MQKVRFLQNYGEFKKDTYRAIINETNTHYVVLVNVGGMNTDTMELPKPLNKLIFEVVERN